MCAAKILGPEGPGAFAGSQAGGESRGGDFVPSLHFVGMGDMAGHA